MACTFLKDVIGSGTAIAHAVMEIDPPVVPLDVRLDGRDGGWGQHQQVQSPNVPQVGTRVHDEQHRFQADVPLEKRDTVQTSLSLGGMN